MKPDKRISESITLILGGIQNILLFGILTSIINSSGGFLLLGGMLVLLYQAIIALIALPFLIKSFRRESIVPWFAKGVVAESILNSLFTIGQLIAWPNKNTQLFLMYGLIALLQLIPLLFYLRNKERISSYEFYENES